MLDLVERLASADPCELSPTARLEALADWERVSAWVEARKLAVLAATVGPQPVEASDDDWVREDIATTLVVSPMTAFRRIELARALDGPLLAARTALEAGRLSPVQVRILAEETEPLSDDGRAEVAKRVLDRAPELTPGRFGRAVRRAVTAVDPRGVEERRQAAREKREVRWWPEADGMASLGATLGAEEVQAIWDALTELADSWTGDGRSLDERRADALHALVTGQAEHPDVAVHVEVDLPTLLGLADNPATLPGYGPIPPAMARDFARDGDWQRWVREPRTGELLDLGRSRYRPSRRLREFITARDTTCRFPGCTRPGRYCDLDHGDPYGCGGCTDKDNLVPLCRRHHRLKTHTRWTYRRLPDGTVEWSSPLGRAYRDPPRRE